jgi:hypothetical protein
VKAAAQKSTVPFVAAISAKDATVGMAATPRVIAALIEKIASECVLDRKRFPDGDLQSFLKGYWQPVEDRQPLLAPFKEQFFELVRKAGAR